MASKLSIRKAQVHMPNTCAWCDSVQDVNWYCNDCQEALCDKCKETHQRTRRTRNDDVVPIKRAKKQGESVLPEVCKIHPGKTCDLFCTECNVTICSMCFTTKHKQHAFKHFEEELENGQKLSMTEQNTIACDGYDRVFIPDIDTNQVYVISTGSEKQAKSVLDKEHGVDSPTSVCLDKCGHIWIGCVIGRVHVVHL